MPRGDPRSPRRTLLFVDSHDKTVDVGRREESSVRGATLRNRRNRPSHAAEGRQGKMVVFLRAGGPRTPARVDHGVHKVLDGGHGERNDREIV